MNRSEHIKKGKINKVAWIYIVRCKARKIKGIVLLLFY